MNKEFKFKYTAPSKEERKEIESIRNSYLNHDRKQISKLQQLRNMDAKVKNIPVALALIFGIVGTLIFGLGMAMVLEWSLLIWGILVCFVGLIPCGFAYPVFLLTTKRMREKYSNQILSLSEELLNENSNISQE